jgi:hypothetical protein
LHDVSILQANVLAETEAVSSKEMHMDVSPAAVSLIFEMMVLNVLQTMAHFSFTTTECPGPVHTSFPFDGHGYGHGLEFRVDDKFWPQRRRAKFGSRKVEIVFLLELMVRKLVPHSHPDSVRPAIWSDEVDAGDLSFIPAILGIGWDVERFPVCA